jgi:hypothetical protein
MLFEEIIDVYCENHMKSLITLCGQNAELLIIKWGGTYSYQWTLKAGNFLKKETALCSH